MTALDRVRRRCVEQLDLDLYRRARLRAEWEHRMRKYGLRILEMLLAAAGIAYIAANLVPAKAAGVEGMYERTPSIIEQYRQPNLRDKDGVLNGSSCCGPSDAYWADEWEVNADGNLMAIITDPRDDDLFRGAGKAGMPRAHLPIGTRIEIPANKVILFPEQPPNTTGHGWIWVSVYEDEITGEPNSFTVICYMYPTGG